jgi:hypothetical protein
MAELGPEYIASMREALSSFYDGVGSFTQDQGGRPAPGSQADTERATFPKPESLITTWSIATLLIESGGEHVTAFVKTITEPMEPIACWTCVRSTLESCALASWLLDPDIDAHARVGRTFALRYEGLDQQLKLGPVAGRSESELKKQRDHIDKVEQHALNLGYTRMVDSKGKRTGIGQRMPSATEVIKSMLDEEAMYRLLSAVAHGHQWAILGLGFEPTTDQAGGQHIGGVNVSNFQKTANLNGLAYLGMSAAKAFTRPLWNQCHYAGWDEARLTGILEGTFDKLQAKPTVRFWKSPSS